MAQVLFTIGNQETFQLWIVLPRELLSTNGLNLGSLHYTVLKRLLLVLLDINSHRSHRRQLWYLEVVSFGLLCQLQTSSSHRPTPSDRRASWRDQRRSSEREAEVLKMVIVGGFRSQKTGVQWRVDRDSASSAPVESFSVAFSWRLASFSRCQEQVLLAGSVEGTRRGVSSAEVALVIKSVRVVLDLVGHNLGHGEQQVGCIVFSLLPMRERGKERLPTIGILDVSANLTGHVPVSMVRIELHCSVQTTLQSNSWCHVAGPI
mmetsp:Transcript_98275/g.275129  ORF Transcript_98275/g.275129 Transcript_98275/m.275129 type:complete len:262 (+) Transcript_98275:546-1331(+)